MAFFLNVYKSIVLRIIYRSMFRKEEMNSELHYQLHLNSIYSQSFSIRAGAASRIHVTIASEFLRGMPLNSGNHKLRRLLKQGERIM